MKTARQELIEELRGLAFTDSHLGTGDIVLSQGHIDELEEKFLEKEKDQMIDFGYKCREYKSILPQDRFKATYNQNKEEKKKVCEHKIDGVCPLHNLFCKYPDCEK